MKLLVNKYLTIAVKKFLSLANWLDKCVGNTIYLIIVLKKNFGRWIDLRIVLTNFLENVLPWPKIISHAHA